MTEQTPLTTECVYQAGDQGSETQRNDDEPSSHVHREAATAANLRSPHTVELLDFGVTEDQTLYFVMELLQGMDLELMVQKHGPLPAARVIHILCEACESLEEAHSRGLVHRVRPWTDAQAKEWWAQNFDEVISTGL